MYEGKGYVNINIYISFKSEIGTHIKANYLDAYIFQ
jgi:hypothetical protein